MTRRPNLFPLPRQARRRNEFEDALAGDEEHPAEATFEGGFSDPEEATKFYLGDTTPEEWEKAQEAITKIRAHIDTMRWFSMGPNSVGAEKQGEKWSELVFAPQDDAHKQELVALLKQLNIFPWEEVQDNVQVLVIENHRDIALLRAALIFDYLMDKMSEMDRERALEELRAELQKYEDVYEKERAARAAQEQMRIEHEALVAKTKKEREALVLKFLEAIPHIDKAVLEARPEQRSREHQFPYGPRLAPRKVEKGRTTGREIKEKTEEPPLFFEADEVLKRFEDDFRTGKLNEETFTGDIEERGTDKRVAGAETPNLSLFPRKYAWEFPKGNRAGYIIEIETGREVHEADIRALVKRFQEGDDRERNDAFKELAGTQRQLILYLVREVRERHPYADPDLLFQMGLFGLMYAADNFSPEEATKFRSYMIPCVEGYMRRVAPMARQGVLWVPVHVSAQRKKFYSVRKAVGAANPAQAPQDEDVARAMHAGGALRDDSTTALDKYVRRCLVAYSEIDSDIFDSEDFTLSDRDMLGELLYLEPAQLADFDSKELKQVVAEVLRSLTPREERILRLRFGISDRAENTSRIVYETLIKEAAERGEVVTENDLIARMRRLTAEGDLTRPEKYAKLSDEDKVFYNRYIELVGSIDENTLESLGQQFSVTRERIRQMEAKALRKLKHPSRSRKLWPFLDGLEDRRY